MNAKTRMIAFASVIAIAAGAVPVASAMGQEAQPNPSQQLIDAAAGQRPVGQPASMTQGTEAPAVSQIQSGQQAVIQAEVARANAERAVVASFEAEVAALRPGQYVWHPERAASGPMEMVVSLETQRIYVYRAGTLIGVSTVSTGMPGHRTPTGSFPIIEKHRTHFSNLYNNAPMPNMQRLTMGGIALHAGVIPGTPASHGCVRLPLAFSRILFDATSRGEVVHIVQRAPDSAHNAIALVRTPRNGMQMASAAR